MLFYVRGITFFFANSEDKLRQWALIKVAWARMDLLINKNTVPLITIAPLPLGRVLLNSTTSPVPQGAFCIAGA